MSIVIENLKEALNGESNAEKKYELYGKQAQKENLNEIAHLFRAISFAESIHIKNHKRALSVIKDAEIDLNNFVNVNESDLVDKLGDTKANLEDSIEGETYETKKMYKKFVKNANKEDLTVAELSFSLARDAEKEHANLFSKYLKKLEKDGEFPSTDIYVCKICGNVELGEPPETCPVCDHGKQFYEKID
ncbi:MAG: Rubrerythrin-2 [Promethearchaeota archaeon]|nr:MAG: Rubrerythrin-2 [Candidatus Lokiarchaeota archaeon]